MSVKKSALGKGLGALISDAREMDSISSFNDNNRSFSQEHNIASILEIPIDKIVTNDYQPRINFAEDSLNELAESIKALGVIQAITVTPLGNKYQIISGERRYRASKLAGLQTIPAFIKNTDSQGRLEMAIVENIQREDLDPIEIALSFARLLDECSMTQETMAERLGKKRASISNYLRLLKLPDYIQANIRNGSISMGHAKVLLSIDDRKIQEELSKNVIARGLSVRQLEVMVKNILNPKPKKYSVTELPDNCYRVLELLGSYFDDNISLKRSSSGKGKITIEFNNDAEINSFLKAFENIK